MVVEKPVTLSGSVAIRLWSRGVPALGSSCIDPGGCTVKVGRGVRPLGGTWLTMVSE
jgi:hypothetical protein